jgi:hypothetical protein
LRRTLVLQQFYSAFVHPHLKLLLIELLPPPAGDNKTAYHLKNKRSPHKYFLRQNKINMIIVPRWRGPDVQ